jgi:predicted esterase
LVLAGEENLRVPSRVFIPAEAKQGKPLPVVVAVHGLGCTENMFFDAYGRGITVKMCKERGWLLVAPRCSFRTVRVNAIVQELARLYPVDKERVFLVGHSMGAGQVVESACATPEKFAGVAALGGGGKLKVSDALKSLPFFIGVGTEDFAYVGAQDLRDRLREAKVKTVEYREYDIDHLVIVQLAIRDVFAFFDGLAKK